MNEEQCNALASIQIGVEREMEDIEAKIVDNMKTQGEITIIATDDVRRFVEENRDLPIHRVMKSKHFLNLLGIDGKDGANYLCKVSEWPDVNEGFFYRQAFQLGDETQVKLADWLETVYGQCWSLNDESETCYMWEVYGKEDKGDVVQISTTVGKLWDSINSPKWETIESCVYANAKLGKVGYAPLPVFVSHMNRNIEEMSNMNNLNDVAMESLFIKNYPFKFEREIRLVLSLERKRNGNTSSQVNESKGITYGVNPNNLLTRVVASPYMHPQAFENLQKQMGKSQLKSLDLLKRSELFLVANVDKED